MSAKFGADRILLSPPPLYIFCLMDDLDGGLQTIVFRRLSDEALRKRQCTTCAVMNAGGSEKKCGCIYFVAKGTGKKLTKGR